MVACGNESARAGHRTDPAACVLAPAPVQGAIHHACDCQSTAGAPPARSRGVPPPAGPRAPGDPAVAGAAGGGGDGAGHPAHPPLLDARTHAGGPGPGPGGVVRGAPGGQPGPPGGEHPGRDLRRGRTPADRRRAGPADPLQRRYPARPGGAGSGRRRRLPQLLPACLRRAARSHRHRRAAGCRCGDARAGRRGGAGRHARTGRRGCAGAGGQALHRRPGSRSRRRRPRGQPRRAAGEGRGPGRGPGGGAADRRPAGLPGRAHPPGRQLSQPGSAGGHRPGGGRGRLPLGPLQHPPAPPGGGHGGVLPLAAGRHRPGGPGTGGLGERLPGGGAGPARTATTTPWWASSWICA